MASRPTQQMPATVPVNLLDPGQLNSTMTSNLNAINTAADILEQWNTYHKGLAAEAGGNIDNPGGILAQSDTLSTLRTVCTVNGDDQVPDNSTAAELFLICSGSVPTSNVAGVYQLKGTLTLNTSRATTWNGAYRLLNDSNEVLHQGIAAPIGPTPATTTTYSIEDVDWDFGNERIRIAISPGHGGSTLTPGAQINQFFFSGEITTGEAGIEVASYLELPASYDGNVIPEDEIAVGRVYRGFNPRGNKLPNVPFTSPSRRFESHDLDFTKSFSLRVGYRVFPDNLGRSTTTNFTVGNILTVSYVSGSNQGVEINMGTSQLFITSNLSGNSVEVLLQLDYIVNTSGVWSATLNYLVRGSTATSSTAGAITGTEAETIQSVIDGSVLPLTANGTGTHSTNFGWSYGLTISSGTITTLPPPVETLYASTSSMVTRTGVTTGFRQI